MIFTRTIFNNNLVLCSVCSLLVLEKVGESLLNLCLPKDTSSLEGVLLTPMGLLSRLWVRPRREYFTVGLVLLSDPSSLWWQHKGQKWTSYSVTHFRLGLKKMIPRKIYLHCVFSNSLSYYAATFWQKSAMKQTEKNIITEDLIAQINWKESRFRYHMQVCITYLLVDFLMIFILLRSLNPPGEEEGDIVEVCWVPVREPINMPFPTLLLFSDVQWKADFRRATVATPVTAVEVPGPPAFQR